MDFTSSRFGEVWDVAGYGGGAVNKDEGRYLKYGTRKQKGSLEHREI